MKADMYQRIEEQIDRFFEGETSQEEEKELYAFFAGEEIPEHLQPYQSLFRYFENEIATEIQQETTTLPRRRNLRPLWISIAASLLLAALTSLFFFEKADTFDEFEGSYIIRNGERITDLNVIRPELEATLQKALQQEKEVELFKLQIQCSYEEIISQFPEEYARETVRKLLEQDNV